MDLDEMKNDVILIQLSKKMVQIKNYQSKITGVKTNVIKIHIEQEYQLKFIKIKRETKLSKNLREKK